ncbi:9618_t:CDS:1, partial [Rhizophagus irregularis]
KQLNKILESRDLQSQSTSGKVNEILKNEDSQASVKVNETLVSEDLNDCIIEDIKSL